MKKTFSLFTFLFISTSSVFADGHIYVKQVDNILINQKPATSITCKVSNNPLSTINSLQVDLANSLFTTKSSIWGTSIDEVECMQMDTELICDSAGYSLEISDTTPAQTGTPVTATLKIFSFIKNSEKSVTCTFN